MFTTGQVTGAVVCTQLQVIDDDVVDVNSEELDLTISPDDPLVTTVTASEAIVSIQENDNDGINAVHSNNILSFCSFAVAGSVVLSSPAYITREDSGGIDVCAVINVTGLERSLTVLLTSRDNTARGKFPTVKQSIKHTVFRFWQNQLFFTF